MKSKLNNNNYLSVWKHFEIIYGLNFSISINHLVSILNDNGKISNVSKLTAKLTDQKNKIIEKIKIIKEQLSNPTNAFAEKTVELYCRAVIIQYRLMSIQREILKSKASPMEWDDTTLGLLNDVYRNVKGIDANLENIRKHFTQTGEKVPAPILKKYTAYICQKDYSSCRFELTNVMKFFGTNFEKSECKRVPDIDFNAEMSWAEKLFTHRFRTSKQIQTKLPQGNLIILDNTDSPLLYQKSNSISKESKNYLKNTIRGNKITDIMKEAHSYNQYGLKHHGELTITDIARGREQKLQYWYEMDKLSDKLKEMNSTTVSVDAARNPLRFITTKKSKGTNCQKTTSCVKKQNGTKTENGNVKIVIQHSTEPETYSLIKDTHGNTEWKDVEYIPNYMGIMNELRMPVSDFGFKFNKYLANWEKHQKKWTPKYKESVAGESLKYTVTEKTPIKKTINKFKYTISETMERLPNQLLKSNYLGLMNVMAANIEEKSKNGEEVVVDDIESLSKLIKKFSKINND